MKKSTRTIASVAISGALIVAGLTAAQSASADPIGSGTIKLYAASPDGVTRGAEITSGNAADTRMYYGISIDATCPTGYKNSSAVAAFQGGVFRGALSTPADASVVEYGTTGQTAANVNLHDGGLGSTNPYANNKRLNQVTGLVTGAWELRYYCGAGIPADLDFVTDKWFTLNMTFDAASGAWAIAAPVVPAEATTVSLTAGAVDGDVTLTATVKNSSNATATAAAGTVQFFEGATQVGSSAVTAGVATLALDDQPAGFHTYTAKFVSSDTEVYADSPLSGGSSVTILGDNQSPSTVTVTIPSNGGALILSGVPASVDLGTATLVGGPTGTFEASGDLEGVTVTDTRALDFPAWSLTGQVGDFSDGTHTLLGKYLGWQPTKVSGPASSVAGGLVESAPANADGITVARNFATGAPDAAGTVSVFDAALNLKAPGNTPAGTYNATLTITLA